MSETTTEATTESETTTADTTAPDDWQAMARKHEKAAKDLRAQLRDASPKLERLAVLEAAQQTDAERLAAAQVRAEKAENDAMRASVALSKGLPAFLAPRLQGDDLASLEADADELLSLIPADKNPRAPRVDRSQGSSAAGGGAATEGDQFAAFLKQQMGR